MLHLDQVKRICEFL